MIWREGHAGSTWYRQRVYRGRKKGFTVEVRLPQDANPSNGHTATDDYWFHITKGEPSYNSLWDKKRYKTLEEAQQEAEAWIDRQTKNKGE